MYFDPPQSTPDVSAVTPAQRAQIFREEMILIEKQWLAHEFDNIKDLMSSISLRIDDLDELDEAATAGRPAS